MKILRFQILACFLLLSNFAYAELFDSSKRPTPLTNSHIVSSGQSAQLKQPAVENVHCRQSTWCSNANTITEQTICANENLLCLDNKLNKLYRLYRPIEQTQWLNERDSCGNDVACIASSYTQRIAQMSQSTNTHIQSTGKPAWCIDARNTVEKMICDNPELSNLDNTMTSYWNAQPRAWKKQRQKAQRNFLKDRNACDTVECVKTIYVNLLNGWGVNIMNPLSQSTSTQTFASTPLNFSLSTNIYNVDLLKIMYAVRDTYGDNTPLPILLSIAAVHGHGNIENIMQISGNTATAYQCGDISTLEGNINCAGKIIDALAKKYDKDFNKVVADYLTGSPSIDASSPHWMLHNAIFAGATTVSLIMSSGKNGQQ